MAHFAAVVALDFGPVFGLRAVFTKVTHLVAVTAFGHRGIPRFLAFAALMPIPTTVAAGVAYVRAIFGEVAH